MTTADLGPLPEPAHMTPMEGVLFNAVQMRAYATQAHAAGVAAERERTVAESATVGVAAGVPATVARQALDSFRLIAAQDQGCGGNVTEVEAWRAAQAIARQAIHGISAALASPTPLAAPHVPEAAPPQAAQPPQPVQAQAARQPLTDEQIDAVMAPFYSGEPLLQRIGRRDYIETARAIERAHGIGPAPAKDAT